MESPWPNAKALDQKFRVEGSKTYYPNNLKPQGWHPPKICSNDSQHIKLEKTY